MTRVTKKTLRAAITNAQKAGDLPGCRFDIEQISKVKYMLALESGDTRMFEAYAAWRDKLYPNVFTIVLI